jgi:hypothetical protein
LSPEKRFQLMEKLQELQNNKKMIFEKINELEKITSNQRKALMGGEIDTYISLERFRSDIRKEIDLIKPNVSFGLEDYKHYRQVLNELSKKEEDNQRLIMQWLDKIENENDKLRNLKKLADTYYKSGSIPERPQFINKVT